MIYTFKSIIVDGFPSLHGQNWTLKFLAPTNNSNVQCECLYISDGMLPEKKNIFMIMTFNIF